jgi:hypothetical protein
LPVSCITVPKNNARHENNAASATNFLHFSPLEDFETTITGVNCILVAAIHHCISILDFLTNISTSARPTAQGLAVGKQKWL